MSSFSRLFSVCFVSCFLPACEPLAPDAGGPGGPDGPAPVASVQVTAPVGALAVSQEVRLVATLRDAAGNTLPGRTVAWSSSDPSIVTIDNAGIARGVALGEATLHAASEGKSGNASLSVGRVTFHLLNPSLHGTAGALFADTLRVRVVDPSGAPMPAQPVVWRTPASDGWLFPHGDATDAHGIARALWVPGPSPEQAVTIARGADSVRYSGRSMNSVNRANSVHLRMHVPGGQQARGFRVEISPQNNTLNSYYQAIGFTGGYMGLQVNGDLAPLGSPRQVHFAVWDIDGNSASLVDAAGSVCDPFGGEGTGIKCRFGYPWQAGGWYRFELEALHGSTSTNFSAFFTDVATGTRRKIATLRYAEVSHTNHTYLFVEDFGPESPSCLQAGPRSMLIRNAEHRLQSTWARFSTSTFTQYHPRTVCANVAAETRTGGLWLATGSTYVGDPRVSQTYAAP